MALRTPIRIAVVCALALSPNAIAEGLLSFNGQILAASGDPVPGFAPGHVFIGGLSNSGPILNAGGDCFFYAVVSTPSGGTTGAIFRGDRRGELQLILKPGDPEPSGTIPGASLSLIGHRFGVSEKGELLIFGGLSDGGISINDTNNGVIYHGPPGNLKIVARENDFVPGLFLTKYTSLSLNLDDTAVGGDFYHFEAKMTGGGSESTGLFLGGPSGVSLVARTGGTIPGGAEVIASFYVIGGRRQMNSAGQLAYSVRLAHGSGVPAVDLSNDMALFLHTPGIGSQMLVRKGDASPVPGLSFGILSPFFVAMGGSAMNKHGEVLGSIRLSQPPLTHQFSSQALMLFKAAGPTVIAKVGDPAPGVPGATIEVFDTTDSGSIFLTDQGFLTFRAGLSDGTTALFGGVPPAIQVIARTGDLAPGTGGSSFTLIPNYLGSLHSMMINGAGQVLFHALTAGGVVQGESLWSWDPILGLSPALVVGDAFELQAGIAQTAGKHPKYVPVGNGNSRAQSFSDDGDFVCELTFSGITGGTQGRAIVRGHVGSLSAVPKTLSAGSGGTQTLYVNAGLDHGGDTYLIAGAVGTSPGFSVGGVHVPLNPDPYFAFTIGNANMGPYGNTLGVLDSAGRSTATITLPPGIASIVGTTVYHAAMVFNLGGLSFASETTSMTIDL